MENKTGKYFKYAIGEIALVVIGIMIALQINNWNESNKLRKNELKVVEQLITDAIKDSIFFNDRKLALKYQIHFYNSIIEQCNGIKHLNDATGILERKEQPFIMLAHQSNVISNNPNAYNELIDEGLKNEIQKYSAQYDFISSSFKIFNARIEGSYVPLRIKYHNKIPELFKASHPSEFTFLCDVEANIGVVKLIKTYAEITFNHNINFLEINSKFVQHLKGFKKTQ